MMRESLNRQSGISPMAESTDTTVPARRGKVLLLTNTLDESPNGGRELLCKLNFESLSGLYADDLVLFELEQTSPSGPTQLYRSFRGYIDGLSPAVIAELLGRILREGVGTVFIDGSNLGKAAKCIRKAFPEIKIITFFHNVETVFFWGGFLQNKGPRALAVCIINFIAERKAVRFSDRLICLSERDSAMLKKVHGRAATDVSAIALKDSHRQEPESAPAPGAERYALFVGGVFYANLSGIAWYSRHVAPHIGIKTYVVGRGFEKYRDELERHGNIQVIGGVDSVAPWYEGAEFVVAPIFGGSGMKTKVAEALMFGKIVIGTPESFSGYENIVNRAGCSCETAEEFITAIEAVSAMHKPGFDRELRTRFLEQYSCEAARKRIAGIMSRALAS
jgi:glycosyltransferase involved in cell wall biosynthesis